MVSRQSPNQGLAWKLIQVLTEPEFLRSTWGIPGHSVPARRSAASAILGSKQLPANAKAIVAAMEYGQVFQPFTPSAFEAYGKTAELFKKAMTGELSISEATKRIEEEANNTLARDR
jgi:ABC-type glycerol-3-phosphate transport system substrate-binding protein